MSKFFSIHSFRGGTGKTNILANLAFLLAKMGNQVGVIDADIPSPGLHILFGISESDIKFSLNDYLWGKCGIAEAAYDVTSNLTPDIQGKVYLVPSSLKSGEIGRVLREGFDASLLNDGCWDLIVSLDLDVLLLDTHPGINEETLLSIAVSDGLLVVMRPDQQDYQGTNILINIARKLDVENVMLMMNKVPPGYKVNKSGVEQFFNTDVIGILPQSNEMMVLGSKAIFAIKYPNHEIIKHLNNSANLLVAV